MGSSKVDVQKADLTVDDFVLRKPPTSINRHSFQRATRNRVNTNQRTAVFNGVHHDLESGSGPGGRRFKSSLPTNTVVPSHTENFGSPSMTLVASFGASPLRHMGARNLTR
jgi:hypothetical protein